MWWHSRKKFFSLHPTLVDYSLHVVLGLKSLAYNKYRKVLYGALLMFIAEQLVNLPACSPHCSFSDAELHAVNL